MTEPAERARTSAFAGTRIAYGKIVGTVALVITGVVLITTVGVTPPDDTSGADVTQTTGPVPGARTPASAPPAPIDRPHASDADKLTAWAKRLARRTQIPARTLEAYGRTEMWMRSEAPDCRLSWATVAGIADVASAHGTADGAARWDRAVGPLQIMPETWRQWRARAARDGKVPDPHHIDDAALTAGRVLCGPKADLATPNGWWRAVQAYHSGGNAAGFARKVFTSADRYAKLAD